VEDNGRGSLMRGLVLTVIAVSSAYGQWTPQRSNTTASLRGIHNVGGGVVWASGTQGTVLHTVDDGQTWQTCAVPPGAEKLDFRSVQAFDRNIAIVMSSGTGDLSRLYKTMDACRTWKLVFRNPDESGFWDALQFAGPNLGVLIGDQVHGHFPVFFSKDAGDTWRQLDPKALATADKNQSFFAASNSSLLLDTRKTKFYMLTGGGTTSLITVDLDPTSVSYTHLDLTSGETAGGFSLASRMDGANLVMVAVGGDYKAPDRTVGTAAFNIDGQWYASRTSPSGYRSAVAWYSGKTWITVGPTGTDISKDDGRNWSALKPNAPEGPDADKNWNALSLPFAAGPNGRIGKFDNPGNISTREPRIGF
jgi:photosystem II stability/assembly factor-like uncharacterized protein